MFWNVDVAAVAAWSRYRIVAGLVTSLSPVPLKTRRVWKRCTLNLSRAQTSSRWCGEQSKERLLYIIVEYANTSTYATPTDSNPELTRFLNLVSSLRNKNNKIVEIGNGNEEVVDLERQINSEVESEDVIGTAGLWTESKTLKNLSL
ncbi:hypothetical protein TNCV_2531841 [Trichonephila clavipes]|nr:hypothetical protein TNCV_2531841 [Trichonephila clavipes]